MSILDANQKLVKEPSAINYLLCLVGVIFPLGLVVAPINASKYPSVGWRWGLWCSLPASIIYGIRNVLREGLFVGTVATITSPAVVGYITLSVLFAWLSSRRRSPEE